jgi:hypothetical protein
MCVSGVVCFAGLSPKFHTVGSHSICNSSNSKQIAPVVKRPEWSVSTHILAQHVTIAPWGRLPLLSVRSSPALFLLPELSEIALLRKSLYSKMHIFKNFLNE